MCYISGVIEEAVNALKLQSALLIVFMVGIGRTENRAGCITVGVLLHYLILVS